MFTFESKRTKDSFYEITVPNPYENSLLYLNDNMSHTGGALGMLMNKEFVKKAMRRRASRFNGISIADSFTVSNKYSLLIWKANIFH